MKRSHVANWVAIFFGYLSCAVWADQYHNVNQIIGNRAQGMGGAYTAVSDDPAGLYYNPAGIVYASSNNLSASVNTLQTNGITYDDVLVGQHDWQRNSLQLLPNFFGVVQPFGDFKVGISSSTPDSVKENQDQEFNDLNTSIDRFVINLNHTDITYNFGPSIAYEVNSSLSVGLSMAYHYRSSELNQNQYIRFAAGNPDNLGINWSNSYEQTTEHGIRPKLGLMWSPLDKISMGLALDQTYILSATRIIQLANCTTTTTGADCDGSKVVPEIEETDDKRNYPIQVRWGLGYFASNALLVTADVIYNTGTDESGSYRSKEATIDGAMGFEYYLSPSLALRSGFYTRQSNTPELELGTALQEPSVNLWGVSGSVTRFNRDSSLSVGFTYSTGTGKSDMFGDGGVLTDTTVTDFSLYLSTSYSY